MNALRDGDKLRCGRCEEVLARLPEKGPFLQLPNGYVLKEWPGKCVYEMPASRRKRYVRGEQVEHHRKQQWHGEDMAAGDWRWSGPLVRVPLTLVTSLRVQVACIGCTSRNDIAPWA